MTLRDVQYGFLDPGSLFVFVDPYSSYPAVRDHLSRLSSDFAAVAASLRELLPAERRDFLQRATALLHERQHFHDLTMTPHGVTAAYGALIVGIRTMPVLLALRLEADKARSGDRLPVYLPLTGSGPLGNRVRDLEDAFDHYTDLIDRARVTLELSAVVTQLNATSDMGGEESAAAALESLRGQPLYVAAFSRLNDALDGLGLSADEAHRGARALVLAALCGTRPDEVLYDALAHLESIARTVGPSEAAGRGIDLFGRYEARALEVIGRRESEAERLTSAIRDEHDRLVAARSLYTPFVRAAEDLGRLSTAGQRLWRLGSATVSDYFRHSAKELPEPYFYAYSAFRERAVTDVHSAYPDDDLYELEHFSRPDWPAGKAITAQLLTPIDLAFPEGQIRPTKKYWIEMAKSGAGAAGALVQPIDRTSPLQRLWLRTTGDALGIRFMRRPIGHHGV